MNSQRIKFANEFCFTAILEGAESLIELGIVDYQIPQDDLFVKQTNGEFVRMAFAKEKNTVISQLYAGTDPLQRIIWFIFLGQSDGVSQHLKKNKALHNGYLFRHNGYLSRLPRCTDVCVFSE